MKLKDKIESGIWVIYGPNGTGKTSLSIEIINSNNKKVIYLDTKNTLEISRMKNELIKKSFIFRIDSFKIQDEMIRQLTKMNLKRSIIVIDSINHFYRLEKRNKNNQLSFTFQLKILKKLAKNNLVLIIGDVYDVMNSKDFKLYGSSQFDIKNRIKLRRTEKGKRIAEINNKKYEFEIKKDGINLIKRIENNSNKENKK
ncbi:MAG: AAA family ATPase [Candidatus Woesearchaeota archaeon]